MLFRSFIFGCVGSPLLHVDFSLVAVVFVVVLGLPIAVASLVVEHGL